MPARLMITVGRLRASRSRRIFSSLPNASTAAWPARDQKHMSRALVLAARCADTADVPVGALVVCDLSDRVLGESWNQREAMQTPCAHAETLALDAAAKARGQWRLHDTTLYVTLEPCIMCYGAAVLARCGRIVYGTQNHASGALSSGVLDDPSKLNHQPIVVGGLMAEECSSIVRDFFRKMRK